MYKEKSYREAEKTMIRTLKKIKSKIPRKTFDMNKASFSEVRNCLFKGEPTKRVFMVLRGRGCRWAIEHGGCTMCGLTAAQTFINIPADCFIRQFTTECKKYDFRKYPVLCLYNNGSFFNDEEMPPEARNEIFKIITKNPYIKKLVLETRIDSVTREKLEEARAELEDKEVEIAVGLESIDDNIRNLCIHKGFSLKQFEINARLIQKFFKLRVYVLLKPPFLTEKEAVDSAVETIKYAHKIGTSSIHLEVCTVQDYTLTDYLYKRALYRPPWLWGIVKILEETNSIEVYVTPFKYIPFPKAVAHNCKHCNKRVSNALLEKYDVSYDRSVLKDLDCACKKAWESELKKTMEPLPERITHMLKGASDSNGKL